MKFSNNPHIRIKTKGILQKSNKILVKIPLKNGLFWEKEYSPNEIIKNVINDFKEQNQEEIPEEYIEDWKNKNKEMKMEDEIKTLLVKEVLIIGKDNIPDIIGKPFYRPFEIFAFNKKEKIFNIQKFDNKIIEKTGLKYFDDSSAYCNGNNNLFISGGDNPKIIYKFWKINLLNKEIETITMEFSKKNHSMIYIPGNYVFIVGGNNLQTFYYDVENERINDWADLNQKRIEPALILISNYLYCFDNINSKNNNDSFTFEKTDITSENPEWNIIKPIMRISPYKKLNQKFFSIVNNGRDDIIFVGGYIVDNLSSNKCNYMYNINSNTIQNSNIPFKEYNFKEKTFLAYDKDIYYLLPDFNRNQPEIIFYQRIKNKINIVKSKANFELTNKSNNDYKYNFNMPNIILSNDQNIINNKQNNYLKENISNPSLEEGNQIYRINQIEKEEKTSNNKDDSKDNLNIENDNENQKEEKKIITNISYNSSISKDNKNNEKSSFNEGNPENNLNSKLEDAMPNVHFEYLDSKNDKETTENYQKNSPIIREVQDFKIGNNQEDSFYLSGIIHGTKTKVKISQNLDLKNNPGKDINKGPNLNNNNKLKDFFEEGTIPGIKTEQKNINNNSEKNNDKQNNELIINQSNNNDNYCISGLIIGTNNQRHIYNLGSTNENNDKIKIKENYEYNIKETNLNSIRNFDIKNEKLDEMNNINSALPKIEIKDNNNLNEPNTFEKLKI